MEATEINACGKLLFTAVRRSYGEKIVDLTKAAGARGGTVIPGRGKSEARLDRLFGSDDSPEDIIFTLASDEDAPKIMKALKAFEDKTGRNRQGFVVQVDVPMILRKSANPFTGAAARGSGEMEEQAKNVVICVIVNRGCADDIMSAAAKTGAIQGVILGGRGTAGEKDVEFLGIHLFPEKEIIFILARSDQAGLIMDVLKKDPNLARPGGGIAFFVAVEKLIYLGRITD